MHQGETGAPNRLVAARTHNEALFGALHTATAVQFAEKFYVFHQRHFGEPANFEEGTSLAEYPVIAASHSKQTPRVMRKAIG
jgi:hypothetical protein